MSKKDIFQFIKDNLSLEFDISQSWEGTYVSWNYQLKLKNPETDKPEIIDSNSGGFHTT